VVLLLVSGATRTERGDTVGHLIVPRSWNDPDTLPLVDGKWAMDNGCFVGLDPGAFIRMLYAFRRRTGCLFVTVPDAVGDAAETLRLWAFWQPLVLATGRSPAFVAQNGLTPDRVPWDQFGTLFIGGDDTFKESPDARTLCGFAKARGKWVHWGRVNGKRRYELAVKAGCDSIDGTGFSMFPDTNIPLAAQWQAEIAQQPELAL
jgi:hypothetical protein